MGLFDKLKDKFNKAEVSETSRKKTKTNSKDTVKTLQACSNKECSNFGKAILPLETKFCPSCGSPIGGTEVKKNRENTNVATPKVFTVKGVSFTMIPVLGGSYTMSATNNDPDAEGDEKPAHKETVADFMIGETLVTQELWKAVMGNNPSYFKRDGLRPVDSVSWDDCQKFITKLNQLTGQLFRLPYEAEWEYAARGGNRSEGYKYAGGNDEYAVAWFDDNSEGKTHSVKTKKPNELGIYDMSGNVWEWCQDRYSKDYKSPRDSGCRGLRGGSWRYNAWNVRVSIRGGNDPGSRYNDNGLRLAL